MFDWSKEIINMIDSKNRYKIADIPIDININDTEAGIYYCL